MIRQPILADRSDYRIGDRPVIHPIQKDEERGARDVLETQRQSLRLEFY